MKESESMETAPIDRPILVYNEVTGWYISKFTDGMWPYYGWSDDESIHYPHPTRWHELPDYLPKHEKNVFDILRLNVECSAPCLVKNSNGTISTKSIYQILKRLVNKGYVERKELIINITGTSIKRVLYSVKNRTI